MGILLSFRGTDTRYGFADALYNAMKNIGIIVFRDREDLEVGEEINPALAAAIKESQYAVVVVSPQYAKSKACLFELTAIMKCKRIGRLTVFPIFYHVSPSEVGKLMDDVENIFTISKGNPEAAKAKWETWKSILGKLDDYSVDPELDKDLPESCRRALKEASDLSAMVVEENSYETEFAREISFKIFSKLVVNSPSTSGHLVGIESPMIKIMELLNPRDPVRVRVIGICGLPGMGKSILAEEVHNKVSTQFEGQCILYCIGKTTSHKYLVGLQKKLISNILGEDNSKTLGDDDQKVKNALRTRLRKKKVFIVLDDVWDKIQIQYLADSLEWFGDGSKIIITSQKHDLRHLCKKNVYEVQPLNEKDALQLFCFKAFEQCEPKEGFEKLAAEISGRARGLPFALDFFGTNLSTKGSRDVWEGYLEKIGGDNPIYDTLVKIFRELTPNHQEFFLDVAFFFNNCVIDRVIWVDIVRMLKNWGYIPKYDLEVLKDKCLLRISKGGEWLMHDFLVDLGQKLAQGNRLFQKNDIVQALKASTAPCQENSNIIAIVLYEYVPEELSLKALSTMVNLRILYIWPWTDLKWLGNLSKLSKELRNMEWYRYPLNSLPNDANFGIKLVILKLFKGNIHRLWVGEKSFPELKHVRLEYLKKLIAIPDLSGIPKLEILQVRHCKKLSTLPPSVGNLKLLKKLSIHHCKDLQELPDEIISTSLKHLSLKGCPRLKHCPNIPHSLQCLQHLSIGGISIEGLPFSYERLPSLVYFKAYPAHLEELPSFIFSSKQLADLSIKKSDVNPNFRLPTSFSTLSSLEGLALCHINMSDETTLHNLSCLSSLRYLNLSYCKLKAIPESIVLCSVLSELALNDNDFTNLPDVIWKLSELKGLELNSCTVLESLPKLPLSLRKLDLLNCPNLLGYESQTRTCSLIVAYVGFDEKPHKVLHLRTGEEEEKEGWDFGIYPSVVCGPALESPSSELFPYKATHSNRIIKIRMDLNEYGFQPSACVLFIVYEVHHGNEERASKKQKIDKPKSSDSGAFKGRNCIFPELDFKIYHMEGDEENKENAFVVSVPEAAQLRSSYGVWVFINLTNYFGNPVFSDEETESKEESESMQRWSYSASVTARDKNVELKKCWARLIDKGAPSKFFEEINRISRPGLDSKSLPESLKPLLVDFSESDVGGDSGDSEGDDDWDSEGEDDWDSEGDDDRDSDVDP